LRHCPAQDVLCTIWDIWKNLYRMYFNC
jgi:hypothetical protein